MYVINSNFYDMKNGGHSLLHSIFNANADGCAENMLSK